MNNSMNNSMKNMIVVFYINDKLDNLAYKESRLEKQTEGEPMYHMKNFPLKYDEDNLYNKIRNILYRKTKEEVLECFNKW